MKQITPIPKKYLLKTTLFLVIAALIIAVFFAARTFLLNSSGFKINQVSIVDAQGKPLANPQSIFRLNDSLNLFSFEMDKVARDIQARHPEFLSVRVRRQFPDSVLIIVKQREPVAIVGRQKRCLVDETGFILPYDPAYRYLPMIVDIHPKQIQLYLESSSLRLKKALNLLRELRKAEIYPEFKITQIDVSRYSDVVFYLENGIEVKMGEAGFARKSGLLRGILRQIEPSAPVPKYIDMRFGDPAVMP